MRRASVGKGPMTIAACLFVVGWLSDCVSDLPPVKPSARSSASASGGDTSEGAAGGGGNGADGQSAIVTILPSGGASGNPGSADAAPATPDANCGMQTENPTTQPADLLLVLDRSGSMDDDIASNALCGGRGAPASCTPRWPTLTAAVNQVVGASPAGLQWGLKFFTSPGGGTCTVNPGVDVPVPGTAAQIQAAIAGTMPGNATPTTAAINAAVAYLNTLNDGRPHYILLATDGQPNCDPGTSGNVTTTSVNNAAAAIAAAAAPGSDIKTYVIGIGPSAGNLDAFAAAGGTGKYFPANSPDQLTTALGTIVGAVASCVFTMATVPPDSGNLGVYLDNGTKVPLDQTNGYSLGANNLTITINGSYCDGIQAGTYQFIQVFFGCPGIPLPSQFRGIRP
jgi:von Willebrand factor type A domain